MSGARVAVVTGANRGIGTAVAQGLARLGLIVVMGSRSKEKGNAAAKPLQSEGLIVSVCPLDVTDEASVAAAIAETLRLYGRLDVLVNNAAVLLDGPGSPVSRVVSVPAQMVRDTYETNVLGPLRLIQAVLPAMHTQGYGRIVNVSSGAGQLSEMGPAYPAYRLSKAALNALTRTAAAELADTPIKVNAMCPGWVRTDMGGPEAERSVEEGADTALWLATLPDDGPSGGFFRDRKPIAW